MRALGLALLAMLALAAAVILTRDPEESWAVALVILALAAVAGGAATLWQLRAAGSHRRRGSRRTATVPARRGVEVAAVVALLLWLRAVDGLSVLTAIFVVATFVVAELIVSARPHSSR